MNELLDIIVSSTSIVFGIGKEELCVQSRKREILIARKAAAWLCFSEGIPARMLSDVFCTTRWCINRMQSEARCINDVWFWSKVKDIREMISTEIAHNKHGDNLDSTNIR